MSVVSERSRRIARLVRMYQRYDALMMGRERVFRDRLNPLDVFDEFELQQRFRFGYDGILYLVDILRADLEPQTRHRHAISAELQVVVALQFFATGNFLITTGDYIHVHVSTASRIVRKVTLQLARRAQKFIRWPTGAEVAEVQQQFFEMAGFPSVVGAVDGTHIRIQGPSDFDQVYVIRHGYRSINLQQVVDASSQIRHVVSNWPGSANDSKIFKRSSLYCKLADGTYQGLLLGDSGYSCKPWLMTPFLEPSSQPEEEYNKAHITPKCIVERTIGQLKRRFHCLHAELRMRPNRCSDIIVACCILHNLAKWFPCSMPHTTLPAEVPSDTIDSTRPYSVAARAAIVAQFFS